LSGVFLLGTPGFDASGSVDDGKAAQLVGVDSGRGGSRSGVSCVTVRVHCAHAELVTAYSFGPVLADQQRQPFLLMPQQCRLPVSSGGLDGLSDVGHARIGFGALGGDVGCPSGRRGRLLGGEPHSVLT